MVVTALRGAVGFLTRLPVGFDEEAWSAFRAAPWAFPVAGYAVGGLLAVPVALLAAHPPTAAVAYVLAVLALTGVNHLDGVADLADAAVVHGDVAERHEVLRDTRVGVGAAAAVSATLLGLALGALGAAALPVGVAVGVVVAAEVGAKAGMAAVAALGTATHVGMGSEFTARSGPRDLLSPALLSVPAAALSWPSTVAAAALCGSLAGALAALWWARRLLGGVGGDVFGLVNEVGRVAGLHLGVLAWTLS